MAGPMPPGAPPMDGPPQDAPPSGGGGAGELVAGIGRDLMKLHDMVQGQFPEEAEKLGAIVQGYQAFVDEMSAGPGSKSDGPPMPGTTTPEAGAADVKPAM